MLNSKFYFMQYLLAGNSQTDADVLRKLAASPHAIIRRRVGENCAIPLSTLICLLDDESAEVRQSLSSNPSLPKVFLMQLAFDENLDVRYALAEDARIPQTILSILSRDENPYVAHRAALTLERLAQPHRLAMAG